VISFAEGGIRFALHPSSLVSVFQMLSSSTRSSLCTVPALRAYIQPIAPTGETSYILQGLIAWKDILRSLEMQYTHPGSWEVSSIRKTCTAHPANLLFRQVLLSVAGQLLTPHPQTSALNGLIQVPSCTPFKQAEETSIPQIVITPPPAVASHQVSVNMVPMPQDAGFGNQLTVPDPEFTVINCWKRSVDPFSDMFKMDGFGSVADDPFASFGGCSSPSWGDPEDPGDMIECASWEETEEDDAGTLGLGPTWSG